MLTKLNALVGITLIALLAAVFCLWRELGARRLAEGDRAAVEGSLRDAEARQAAAKTKEDEATAMAKALRERAAALNPGRNRPRSPSQTVRDQTAERIRQEPGLMTAARESVVRRIGRLYGPLLAHWQLSPEQSEAFTAALLARTGVTANGYVLTAPDDDPDTLPRLLGESRYAEFMDYEKTLPLRREVEQVAATLAEIEPLSPSATEQLLRAYVDHRALRIQQISPMMSVQQPTVDFYRSVIAQLLTSLSPRQIEVLRLVAIQATGKELNAP